MTDYSLNCCKLFDVKDFYFDELFGFLCDTKDRYKWLILHNAQEDACNILPGKMSKIGNYFFTEFAEGDHFHWVIWRWHHSFGATTLNKFMKGCEKNWDDKRFNSLAVDNCGLSYTSQRVYQMESVLQMYENTDRYVLECSYPPSCWEEFVAEVNKKENRYVKFYGKKFCQFYI